MNRENLIQTFYKRILLYFNVIGISFTVFFGLLNIISGKTWVGYLEIFLSFLAVINAIYYIKTRNFKTVSNIILILVFCVLLLILYTGGYKDQGIFWIFVFPLLTFFLKDKKIAIVWNLLLLFVITIIILINNNILDIPYKFETLFEAFMAYIAVSLLAYFYSEAYESLLKEFNYMATYDKLTNLYNRYFIFDFLKKEIEKIKRKKNQNLCLVYIDLDNFKYINDNFGHSKGDQVLREIAKEFLSNFRKSDVIGRIGGDEFLIIAPFCNPKVLEAKLNDLRIKIEERFKIYKISFSYGLVLLPDETSNPKEAIRLADKKMYETKMRKRLLQEPLIL